MEELIEDLSSRNQKYLFLTSIGEIKGHTGLLLNPETVVAEIADLGKFNIFTMEDSYFFDGVIGGYVTSGELQGKKAARLTLGMQKDSGIHKVENIIDSPNTYIFDQSELIRLGMSLPEEVSEKAIFHNIPPTFYEKNRTLILVISTLLIVTSITIVSFIFILRIKKRDDDRKREEKRTAQLERYQNAMIVWSEASHENIGEAFEKATEISADTLDVKRVGIWLYDEDRTSIECRIIYVRGEGHSSGGVLLRADFPRYFAAIETGRRIVIDDARNDPATCEMAGTYLLDNDIHSILGAPIFYDREIIGVICH